MNAHVNLDDAARELAALQALGALPRGEALDFEVHLAECAACRAAVAAFSRASAALAEATPLESPPASLRAELLRRVQRVRPPAPAKQPWKVWRQEDVGAAMLVRGESAGFEPTALPGVRTRRLFLDEAARRVTMLIRMDPGSSWPAHVHGGAEECYVIEGDLDAGDLHMHAGDYQRVAEGTLHPIQSTEHGCLLLLISSLDDRLVES